MKISEIPIFLFLMFTLVYSVIGNPDNEIWSGAYFFVNYLTMYLLFKNEKSKLNRVVGKALSISIIVFIVLKYFFNFTYERYYTLIPFLISLYWIFKRETK
jgi:hypothetical protein